MPETRSEWVVLVLGLAAVAALVIVALRARENHAAVGATSSAATASRRRSLKPAPTQTATQATVETTDTASTPTPVSSTTVPATAGVDLTLAAARGDCWVEVRASSATGAVLYAGTLKSGRRKTFHAPAALWARFGGAANLDVVLDGRPLPIPAGTYSAIFDSHGFQRAAR
jgi:RodZ C-terminal domain